MFNAVLFICAFVSLTLVVLIVRANFNQVFNENPGYWIGEWRAGGRLGGRGGAYPK